MPNAPRRLVDALPDAASLRGIAVALLPRNRISLPIGFGTAFHGSKLVTLRLATLPL